MIIICIKSGRDDNYFSPYQRRHIILHTVPVSVSAVFRPVCKISPKPLNEIFSNFDGFFGGVYGGGLTSDRVIYFCRTFIKTF